MTTLGVHPAWLGVEIRHLLALRAVAEEGSFGGAAVRLAFTQPAVSKQIASLEQRVGLRLIERPQGHRSLRLTKAGELLLARADNILEQLELAGRELDRHSSSSWRPTLHSPFPSDRAKEGQRHAS